MSLTGTPSADYLTGLVEELRKQPRESEWVEFKVNQSDPRDIGEYISALANSAALNAKDSGYLLWGIDDETHEVVGTRFSPFDAKKGNEPLETFLLHQLNPKIHFRFFEVMVSEQPVVLLEIARAYRHPVRFQQEAFIRIGQVKKPLKAAPEHERGLWRMLDRTSFEELVCAEKVTSERVLQILDYPPYFDLTEQPLPTDRNGILAQMEKDKLIVQCAAGGWNITNLGGVLFAKHLPDFPNLKRKAIRVIQYRGKGRIETIREQEGAKGYASGFEGLIGYINGLLPTNEVIEQALRKVLPMYPELAVRELVANALIHQDFQIEGAGPMVEIFTDRVEITNPGEPLVDTLRFIDSPPRSRNESLASLMRRFRICEERGSGIDKVIFQIELFQLPAPIFERSEGFTRVVLFAHRSLSAMNKADRVRACYLHACLCYVTRKPMTNSTVRKRFGIDEKNAAIASRLLNEAVDAGMILVQDPEAGTRSRTYLPFWADNDGESIA